MIEIRDLCKHYSEGRLRVQALERVNLRVERGEFLAVIGPSGSGKSTLMNLLGCLDLPSSGSYRLDGSEVTALGSSALAAVRAKKIGFVFQGFNLLPRLSALENVALPLLYLGVPPGERSALAREALERVGLKERLRHSPAELSGGQQQRVAIARALIASPPLILADEPTGNLDAGSGGEVMALFHGLNRQGHTIVLITHDQSVAAQAGRRVAIRDGRLFA
ncbi:MAG: ABC transporter ATP-binding protein [Christensenellaceae bacterium]|jgi:putative ABC transport system ATP-binding protein|nr:ABC transporter ATP-binding protein [Christensenellaceae bacterium]